MRVLSDAYVEYYGAESHQLGIIHYSPGTKLQYDGRSKVHKAYLKDAYAEHSSQSLASYNLPSDQT